MCVAWLEIDEVEEVLLHEGEVAAWMISLDPDIFVEVERGHIAEAVVFTAAGADDAVVHEDGRASGRQSEHDLRIAPNGCEEDFRGACGKGVVVVEDLPVHALSRSARNVVGRAIPAVLQKLVLNC